MRICVIRSDIDADKLRIDLKQKIFEIGQSATSQLTELETQKQNIQRELESIRDESNDLI